MEDQYVIVDVKDDQPYHGAGCWTLLKNAEDYYFHTYYEQSAFTGNMTFKLELFEKDNYISKGKIFLDGLSNDVNDNPSHYFESRRLSNEENDVVYEIICDYWRAKKIWR